MIKPAWVLALVLAAACGCSTIEDRVSTLSGQIRVKTNHGELTVDFSEVRKFADTGYAFFTFVKNDPRASRVEWWQRHVEGEQLGMSYEEESRSFLHEVFSEELGRKVLVSFETGLTIKSISPCLESNTTVRSCPLPVWPSSPTCPGPLDVKVRVDEIILEDSAGGLHVHRKPSPPDTKMGLCRLHGGTRESPSWTEAQARAQRELEAKGWLWRADQDWLSRNPKVRKQAQDAYRKLLKDYPQERTVVRNMDRIRSRIEADAED